MKFERVKGNVPVFSGEYDGRDRTIFGGTTQSNDINQQFTPEFKKGWGIVGKNEFPTLQDFNALGFTHSALIGYLYQSGVAQWVAGADYYTGSIAVQGVDLYVAIQDKPTSQPSSLQGWRLVSPALLNTTGNSTSAPMTQKAVTDALAKKWDIQATTGSGNVARMSEVQKKWDIQQTVGYGSGKVMREGAYGLGGQLEIDGDLFLKDKTGFYRDQSSTLYPSKSNVTTITTGYAINRMNGIIFQAASLRAWVYESNSRQVGEILTDFNTRTDKNNVLHSGTSTPINTLNVSDMAQDVVDRDDMTVTSGAVYRGLEKKITGGSVVQKTGISTVDVISQKAFTDMSFGIGQKWVDVTSQRSVNTNYVNNTGKPIFISIYSNHSALGSKSIKVFIDGIVATYADTDGATDVPVNLVVPVGSTYKVELTAFILGTHVFWTELR